MPFGYPNGGMENPLITFMSPSVIKAGKDAVHVAAHEIVHSWFGNLVTCANWSHTWLNEGLTVFNERRTVDQFFGREFYEQCAAIGMYDLGEEVKQLGEDAEPTKLLCQSNRLCPEFCFTSVQYEKGFVLVEKLERLMGRVNFRSFMRAYLMKHKFGSVTVDDFRSDFNLFATVLSRRG